MPIGKPASTSREIDVGRRSAATLFRSHLPFGLTTSQFYSELMARARASGKAIGTADAHIAATAVANDIAISTRDVSPFEAAGLKVINPGSR